MSEFGDYLKKLRGKNSLRDVAEATRISHSYLGTLERGFDPRTNKERKPSFDVLKKLADHYGVEYLELLNKAGYLDHEARAAFASDLNKFGIGYEWQDGKTSKHYIDLELHLLDEIYEFSYKGKKITMDERKELLNYVGYLITKREANKEGEE